jgi:hypothetical protein
MYSPATTMFCMGGRFILPTFLTFKLALDFAVVGVLVVGRHLWLALLFLDLQTGFSLKVNAGARYFGNVYHLAVVDDYLMHTFVEHYDFVPKVVKCPVSRKRSIAK